MCVVVLVVITRPQWHPHAVFGELISISGVSSRFEPSQSHRVISGLNQFWRVDV